MIKQPLKTVPLRHINIHDKFWDQYIRLVKEVLIPYQWDILNDRLDGVETSHCIQNFKIAAGEASGNFEGAVFQDTDVAKWLEAVSYVLGTSFDQDLERLADETINLIGRAQCEDGYINTYFTINDPSLRWTNLKEGHELYTAGHMIEAAVAYYEATGKKEFLEIMERFADLICQVFGPEEGKCHGYPGHQEIELALIRLYHATGKRKYVELAKYFIDRRGVGDNYFLQEEKRSEYKQIFPEFAEYDTKYSQSHLPVREQTTAEGHAVRAVYMYCAMADLAQLYEDEELLSACKTLWDDMVKRRMYITGSIGASGILERFTTDYDLPNNCNYSETCASIGLALFGKRMAQITKDASYIDVVERALYNTVLSGIAMDGKSFFYVNPLEVWPDNCMERTSKEHVKAVRQTWFGVACCPPNIARTLASMGQYMYFTDEDTLYVNLYITNTASVEVSGGQVKVEVGSDLTNSGHVVINVTKDASADSYHLALRIPDYVKEYKILGDSGEISGCRMEKGYLYIDNLQEEETKFVIDFEVPARFVRANPKVREDAGKIALVKGPLVYCLEEVDNGENLPAIFVDANQELEERFEEDLLGGITTITLTGKRLTDEEWQDDALYGERKNCFQEVELKAVPYHRWNNRGEGEMLVWMKELL
ncbi:glycoside hydrolase family 127 protein [Bariatricus sp. SGI.154]|uniref:glycoside hydrolase family 127 protein n=1 Tax=Bariatricus sp. SGI.154 TaxID=3420549 RepID=UPI003D04173B